VSEWKGTKLGELISIKGGFSYKGKYIGSGSSILLGMGCVSFNHTFLNSGARFYGGETPDSFLVKSGDIVLATRQQSDNLPILGAPAIIPDELNHFRVIVGTNLYKLVNESEVENDYLFWLLKSPDYRNHIDSCAKGSTVKMITKDAVESFEFQCPDKNERNRISDFFWSIEKKIDLLHRQNTTLERMAETLFRQWFVEEFQEDWEEVPLGDAVETTSGGTPSRSNMDFYQNGTINWVKSKELSGSFILDTEEKITVEALKKSSAKLLPKHSILIAMYGATVGEYAIIAKEMTCNQAVCALKPNEKYPYTFLFLYVKSYQDELINMAVGSAQQNISQLLIKQLSVPTCHEKISEFHKKTEAFFEKIKNNTSQIQTLEKLRDNLLPKLMSGEIRVGH